MDLTHLGSTVVSSLVFSTIGLVVFALGFKLVQMLLPFSIKKEIEDDQNVALGIVLGAVIVGLAIIVAAAIHG